MITSNKYKMPDCHRFPDEVVDLQRKQCGGGGNAQNVQPQPVSKQARPEQVVFAGDQSHGIGGVPGFFLDEGQGEFQILPGGSGLIFHPQAALVDAHGGQFLEHAQGLGGGFVLALTTGQDGDGVGMGCQIVIGSIDAIAQGQGRPPGLDFGAQHQQIVRIRTGIPQAGVEMIGNVDAASTIEIIRMAKQSLEIIDPVSILCLSHTGFAEGILEACQTTDDQRTSILQCLRNQNLHDMKSIIGTKEPREGWLTDLSEVLTSRGSYRETLAIARRIAVNDRMSEALDELEFIGNTLATLGMAEGIRVDFTMQSDLTYYNGILMQGYVEKYPGIILTGGRYDRLLAKFHKNLSALGFALNLGDLNFCYPNPAEYDADVLLLYSSGGSIAAVLSRADALRREGKRVHLSQTIPHGFSAKEIIDLRKEVTSC